MIHTDVLVVGAGLSGIAAGYYLQTECPDKDYLILEGRAVIGGTWDLFRYPGVRSDSDMYTLGYSFRPWENPKAIADGPSILAYIKETAAEYGIDEKIRFGHYVTRAEWHSDEALWHVEAQHDGETVTFTCNFLYMSTGYYDYERGYLPDWPTLERFGGEVVHPQFWPEDLDYSGKRVVIIGSGATAVTLAPTMAEQAAHITMLQRSPTYVVNLPSEDKVANWLHAHLPSGPAHWLARWKSLLLSMVFYLVARWRPEATKERITSMVQEELGPEYDVETHFTPHYNPWDQRLCMAPDGDLFQAIRAGQVDVVTDHIEAFDERGICLRSGERLEADIIVTATGLVLKVLSGIDFVVDGEPVDLSETLAYKGMMFSNIPNMALAFGYTNASWTLKCELSAEYMCRLLNYMDAHGYQNCAPRLSDPDLTEEPLLDFTSGYVQRSMDELPSQGSKMPWKVYQNYLLDMLILRFGRVKDGTMEFR